MHFCIPIKYGVLILCVFLFVSTSHFYSMFCLKKMYVFIAPVTQLAAAECIFE